MASFGEDQHDGTDDDTLPEPIYLSRRVLDEYYASRPIQPVEEDELFESEDEAEEPLDLASPPLESWVRDLFIVYETTARPVISCADIYFIFSLFF